MTDSLVTWGNDRHLNVNVNKIKKLVHVPAMKLLTLKHIFHTG